MQHIKKVLLVIYQKYRWKFQTWQFNRYRKLYASFSFEYKVKLANKWLIQYPEQAHFDINPIIYWFENVVEKPTSVLEIGGWRGDLAKKVLSSFKHIEKWHNYDLINYNAYQKCYDKRYKLISLNDYIWHASFNNEYNALIATHMIEHISWQEFTKLTEWIDESIKTVLFEAPIPQSNENINWKGDHSSHILEKGWEQVINEMKRNGFSVNYKEKNTVIFTR
jgi:hypothetical protein